MISRDTWNKRIAAEAARGDRMETITQEVPAWRTGLRYKCYVHISYAKGRVAEIRLSEKGKDDTTLDRLFHAIGDVLTDIAESV